jgi:hypothetical protein
MVEGGGSCTEGGGSWRLGCGGGASQKAALGRRGEEEEEDGRWAGREAEAQWGGEKWLVEKKIKRATAGPKGRMGWKWREKFFSE